MRKSRGVVFLTSALILASAINPHLARSINLRTIDMSMGTTQGYVYEEEVTKLGISTPNPQSLETEEGWEPNPDKITEPQKLPLVEESENPPLPNESLWSGVASIVSNLFTTFVRGYINPNYKKVPPDMQDFPESFTLVLDADRPKNHREFASWAAENLRKPDYEKLLASREGNPEMYKNYLNRFVYDNPNDPRIPEAAQAVYKKSDYWNPSYFPENYIECVAFVHMMYNVDGIKLPAGLGNAKDWVAKDENGNYIHRDIFDIYKSGESTEPIQEMDIMVWDDGKYGHIGVVTGVKGDAFDVANANSTSPAYRYYFKAKEASTVKILDVNGKEIGWRPDYWLRYKKW